jgi:hypothetical protein
MTLKAFVRTIRDKLLRWKMPSVELASGRVGKLSVSIIAYIAENGDLHVNRDDSGPGASEHYGGNTNAQHEIAKFAASKGIKVTRFHWP